MISFGLDEDLSMMQTAVRDFAAKVIRPKLRELEKKGVPDGLRKEHRELGLFGVAWPESAGGQGLGWTAAAVLEEELAYGDVGAAVALDATGIGGHLLAALPAAHPLLAKYAGEPTRILALGIAEPPHKDGAQLATVAKGHDAHWHLEGVKSPVLFAAEAADLLVLAQIEGAPRGPEGYGLFLVERAKKGGWKCSEKRTILGLEACPAYEVTLDKSAEVTKLAGWKELAAALPEAYDRIALVNAARAVGVAHAAYEYAVNYSGERTAFGKPIGHFQALAFLLADMATAIDAARALVWKGAWALDQGKPEARVAIMSAAAQAAETAFFCTNNGVQVLGGAGYVKDHPSEKWMRDARALALLGFPAACASAFLGAEAAGRTCDPADAMPLPEVQPALT